MVNIIRDLNKNKRVISPVIVVVSAIILIILIAIIAYQIVAPEFPATDIDFQPVTESAISGIWVGTVFASKAGMMNSVIITLTNGTFLDGIISDNLIEEYENNMTVSFKDLAVGSYELVFYFTASSTEDTLTRTIIVVFN